MKVEWTPPSLRLLKKLQQDDVLRNLAARKIWSQETTENFTRDLALRIKHSRFDARLMESCIERIVLFSDKIHLGVLLLEFRAAPWPQSFCCVFDWARGCLAKDNITHSIWRLLRAELKKIRAPSFECYYFDLLNPTSNRSITAMTGQNAKQWERNHFWSVAAPYSKELLFYIEKQKEKLRPLIIETKANLYNVSPRLSRRCIQNSLKEFFQKNSGRYFSVSNIEETLQPGCSRRQLLRHLAEIKELRLVGKNKGARWVWKGQKKSEKAFLTQS